MWSSSRLWDDEILCAALRLWASFRRRRSIALRENPSSSSFIGVVVVYFSIITDTSIISTLLVPVYKVGDWLVSFPVH